MFTQVLLWLGLILPWCSIIFIKKSAIKRYMPVTVFTALIMTIIFEIAYTYEWWSFHKYILPFGYITNPLVAYGYFAVATLWIFYLTSYNFWIYLLTNTVINFLWALKGFDWVIGNRGVATMENLGYWQWFFIHMSVSLVIYVYHRWQEKIFISPENTKE